MIVSDNIRGSYMMSDSLWKNYLEKVSGIPEKNQNTDSQEVVQCIMVMTSWMMFDRKPSIFLHITCHVHVFQWILLA